MDNDSQKRLTKNIVSSLSVWSRYRQFFFLNWSNWWGFGKWLVKQLFLTQLQPMILSLQWKSPAWFLNDGNIYLEWNDPFLAKHQKTKGKNEIFSGAWNICQEHPPDTCWLNDNKVFFSNKAFWFFGCLHCLYSKKQ